MPTCRSRCAIARLFPGQISRLTGTLALSVGKAARACCNQPGGRAPQPPVERLRRCPDKKEELWLKRRPHVARSPTTSGDGARVKSTACSRRAGIACRSCAQPLCAVRVTGERLPPTTSSAEGAPEWNTSAVTTSSFSTIQTSVGRWSTKHSGRDRLGDDRVLSVGYAFGSRKHLWVW